MPHDPAAGRAPARPVMTRRRALVVRTLVILVFLPAALVCLYAPFLFSERDGRGLLDDSWALLGGGTAEGVPVAYYVSCIERNTGGGSRSLRSRDWVCVIDLAQKPQPVAAPARPLTAMEQVEHNTQRGKF
jgi:hypothetical protein